MSFLQLFQIILSYHMKTTDHFISRQILICTAIMFCVFSSCCDENESSNLLDEALTKQGWVSDVDYDIMFWGDYEATLTKGKTTLYFLGEGKGVGKILTKEYDTHFGSSVKNNPYEFNYIIDGSSVKIGQQVLKYQDNMLVSSDGEIVFKPTNIDYQWLESAKYYLLPDKDRLNFDFFYSCEEDSQIDMDGNNLCIIKLSLGVKAKDKVFSRGCTMIRGEYHISNGVFFEKIGKNTQQSEIQLLINDDGDLAITKEATVLTTSQAIITASFTAYDTKNKKQLI